MSNNEASGGAFHEAPGDEFNQIIGSSTESFEAFDAGVPGIPKQCQGCAELGGAIADVIDMRDRNARELDEEIGYSPVDPILKRFLARMYEARTIEDAESEADSIKKIEIMIAECPFGPIQEQVGEDGKTYVSKCGSRRPVTDE